jgi:beta-lactamase regulating signal transducer with metallopeptidase domain
MNRLVILAGIHGRQLVAWLGTMNKWTAVLFVGALALDHLLTRRVRASWRIALYAPIVLRVLLPTSWTLAFARAPEVVTRLTPVPVDLPAPPEMASVAPSLGWPAAAIAVYACVALLLAYGMLRRRLSARRVLEASRPVSGELTRLTLPCPLVEHAEEGPMVVGLVSPRIVLPSRLLATGDSFALASVLGHESAHLARRDAWLSAGMQVALVALWPVLPLWAASWRVRQLMEIACDEGALHAADANERRHYGHALLDLADWRSIALTPMAAELHFGSTLRARIEALAWTKRWPLAVQVALVAALAAAFGACSSVAPGPQGAGEVSPARAAEKAAAWTPPPAGESLWSISPEKHGAPNDSLEKYCGPLIERVKRVAQSWKHWESDWMSVPTDGLPAEQVSFCRSPRELEVVRMHFWSAEARNALGQIAKDTHAAYEERRDRGNPTLCPSAPPIPREPQAPNTTHVQTKPSEWDDGAGFECIRFAFDVPTFFQYRVDNDPTHFSATAHGQRTIDGHLVDVTMVIRGEVKGRELEVAPFLEETWKALD